MDHTAAIDMTTKWKDGLIFLKFVGGATFYLFRFLGTLSTTVYSATVKAHGSLL